MVMPALHVLPFCSRRRQGIVVSTYAMGASTSRGPSSSDASKFSRAETRWRRRQAQSGACVGRDCTEISGVIKYRRRRSADGRASFDLAGGVTRWTPSTDSRARRRSAKLMLWSVLELPLPSARLHLPHQRPPCIIDGSSTTNAPPTHARLPIPPERPLITAARQTIAQLMRCGPNPCSHRAKNLSPADIHRHALYASGPLTLKRPRDVIPAASELPIAFPLCSL